MTTRKTCDVCKARKVRCIKQNERDQQCMNCIKRGEPCHFSSIKKRKKRNEDIVPSASGPSSVLTSENGIFQPQRTPEGHATLNSSIYETPGGASIERPSSPKRIYVDMLIEDKNIAGRDLNVVFFKSHERYMNSSSIAFFSESRVRALNTQLHHTRVRQILDALEEHIRERVYGTDGQHRLTLNIRPSHSLTTEQSPVTQSYIRSYFLHVHPIYPFLDKRRFEARAFSANLSQSLKEDKPWSALYFTILALGCQYHGEGSFEPGMGKPWNYFQIALESIRDLLVPKACLTNAQAMTAMAIFALNISCLEFLELLATEAARIALALNLHQSAGNDEHAIECQRAFWVIYCIEKEFSFYAARVSTIADFDIGCPIPEAPANLFGNFNWLLCYVRYARILSKAYESLFSITATLSSPSAYCEKINAIQTELDTWRDLIPLNFRPGQPFQRGDTDQSASRPLAVKIHCSYYYTLISLSRLKLHISTEEDEELRLTCKSTLMHGARSIINLTQYIDLAPYTSLWILGHPPLTALFILFDFVVHNPQHPETRKNLAFLDIVAGYFTRFEFASENSVPSSLFAEFTHIARQYVQEVQSAENTIAENATEQRNELPIRDMSALPTQQSDINLSLDMTSTETMSQLLYPGVDIFQDSELGDNPGFDVANFFGWSLADVNISAFDPAIDPANLSTSILRSGV